MKLLRKYDIFVSVGDLHRSKTNLEHAQKLLHTYLKGACAQQAKSKVSSSWDGILFELFELRGSCEAVSVNQCFELFCNMLLTSGSESNILIILGMLDSSKASHETQELVKTLRRSGVTRLTNETLVKIGLDASNFYLEASRDCSDPSLKLADFCLTVCSIGKENPKATLRGNLLTAIKILSGFQKIEIIPKSLQSIRDSQSLQKFAERLMKSEPFTIKIKERIMNIVKNLRIALEIKDDGTDIEGQILNMMANFATEMGNFKLSLAVCEEIIQSFSGVGWESCYNLSSNVGFMASKEIRDNLLSFCSVHATGEMIAKVIDLKIKDDTRKNYKLFVNRLESRDCPESEIGMNRCDSIDEKEPTLSPTESGEQMPAVDEKPLVQPEKKKEKNKKKQ